MRWQIWLYCTDETTDSGLDCSWGKLPELVHRAFLVMAINSDLNGSNDYMMWLDPDIEMILDNDEDDEVFNGFTAKDFVAAAQKINKLQTFY